MKHKLSSVCSLLLALLLVLGLVGCNGVDTNPCEHHWQEANCTLPKTCTLCGAREGEKIADAHAWLPTDEQSNCLDNGKELQVCVYCEETRTVSIDACGHTIVNDRCVLCGRVGLNNLKNVIYIIGDGMGMEHIAAGQYASGNHFAFTEWQFAASNTDSLTPGGKNASELTDSAASGTALATGRLTLNGYVGLDQNKVELITVLDTARSEGKKTGVITTDNLYGATPGAFTAHCDDRNESMEILLSQIQTSNVDFLCGAVSTTASLTAEMIASNGYTWCQTMPEVKQNAESADKLYCTLDMEGFSTSEAPIRLATVTETALSFLDCKEGFVLMIEQAHVDKASHNNDFEKAVKAVNSLNDTVNMILSWLGDRTDTAIVITADHETGGLSVSGTKTLPYSYKSDTGSTIYYRFTTGSHTNSDVGLFIYGAAVNIASISYFKTPYQVKNSDIAGIVRRLIANKR